MGEKKKRGGLDIDEKRPALNFSSQSVSNSFGYICHIESEFMTAMRGSLSGFQGGSGSVFILTSKRFKGGENDLRSSNQNGR